MLPGKNPQDAAITLTVQCLQILQHNEKFRYYAYTTFCPKTHSPWVGNKSRSARPHLRLSTDAGPRSTFIFASLDPDFAAWSSTSNYLDWWDRRFRLWRPTKRKLDLKKDPDSLYEWHTSEHWSTSMDEGLQSWTGMSSTLEGNKALGPHHAILGEPEPMTDVQQPSIQPPYHNVRVTNQRNGDGNLASSPERQEYPIHATDHQATNGRYSGYMELQLAFADQQLLQIHNHNNTDSGSYQPFAYQRILETQYNNNRFSTSNQPFLRQTTPVVDPQPLQDLYQKQAIGRHTWSELADPLNEDPPRMGNTTHDEADGSYGTQPTNFAFMDLQPLPETVDPRCLSLRTGDDS